MKTGINVVCNSLFKFFTVSILPLILNACFLKANINFMDQGKLISNLPSQNEEEISPVKLVFVKQPVGLVAPSVLLSQQPAIELQDSLGNIILSGPIAAAKINLSLSSGTGVLIGTLSASATAGRLDFTDLMVDQEGIDKKITATLDLSAADLNGLVSSSVSVTSDAFIVSSVAPPTKVYSYYSRSLATNPSVRVAGVTSGDQVILYSDNCQTEIGNLVASSTTAYFYLSNLSPGEDRLFKARIAPS